MALLLTVASVFCASLPMAVFLALAWLGDRYDRQPLWLVLLSFVWGATGAVLIALPLNTGLALALSTIAPQWAEPIGATVGAPLFEEPAKAAFLAFVAWNRRPNDMSSGFVYGAAIGLGFGMTENLLYFTRVAGDPWSWAFTVLVRTFYSALLHAMASSVVGAAFGFGRLRGPLIGGLSTLVGLSIAVVLHALWNGLLTLDAFTPVDLKLANFVLLPLEILFVLGIWQICLFDDALAIRRELQEEEDAGRLPADHAWMLASWFRRRFTRFVPPGVDRDRYVRSATALARRKRQLRLLEPRAPDFYRDDVRRLRRQVEMLLEPARSPAPER